MTGARPVRAVLFDLDGTLMDSETQTDEAIAVVMARHGVPGYSLPHEETRGRTWEHVAEVIRAQTELRLSARALAAELLERWNEATTDVKPIPGSPAAVRAAFASGLKLAVVSSSPRSVIDSFVDRLGVADCIDRRARIGGDSVTKSKPDPECFLMGAGALGSLPAATLVFEDSRAGLLAARAAGMRSMFVSCVASDIAGNSALATASCTDYRALPPRFWAGIADGSLDIDGRSFA